MWKKGKGFTLIELMVVVAIILILALIAIPAYRNMQDRARRSRVQSDLRTLANAFQMFYTDWNQYPVQTVADTRLVEDSGPGAEILGATGATINISDNISSTGEPGGIEYIENLPIDPFDPAGGCYYYLSDGAGACWVMYSFNEVPGEYIYRDSDGAAGIVTTAAPAPPCVTP